MRRLKKVDRALALRRRRRTYLFSVISEQLSAAARANEFARLSNDVWDCPRASGTTANHIGVVLFVFKNLAQ